MFDPLQDWGLLETQLVIDFPAPRTLGAPIKVEKSHGTEFSNYKEEYV